MRRRRVLERINGMKYSWKGHKDRNRHKNRTKKRSGQARLVYVFDIRHNIPTTWRWIRGDQSLMSFADFAFHHVILISANYVQLSEMMIGFWLIDGFLKLQGFVETSANLIGLIVWTQLDPCFSQSPDTKVVTNRDSINNQSLVTKTREQHVGLWLVLYHYYLFGKPPQVNQLENSISECNKRIIILIRFALPDMHYHAWW